MVAAVVLIRAVPGDVPALARRIAGIGGVTEVYSVSGEWDLIAVLRVKEYERIAEIVTEEIAQVSGMRPGRRPAPTASFITRASGTSGHCPGSRASPSNTTARAGIRAATASAVSIRCSADGAMQALGPVRVHAQIYKRSPQ